MICFSNSDMQAVCICSGTDAPCKCSNAAVGMSPAHFLPNTLMGVLAESLASARTAASCATAKAPGRTSAYPVDGLNA